MMALGHQLTGYAAGLIVAPLVPHPPGDPGITTALFVGIVGFGALLPDMDIPGSKASKVLGPITWILAWLMAKISVVFYEATRTAADRDPGSGHRTLTHTAFWGFVVGGLTYAGVQAFAGAGWAAWAAVAIMVGHFAHLAGDAPTLYGIPFWAPFWKRNGKRWASVWICPKPLRFRAGGHLDKNRIKERSRWAWINIAEGVLTAGLAIEVGLLCALTLMAAGQPWWTAVGLFLAS